MRGHNLSAFIVGQRPGSDLSLIGSRQKTGGGPLDLVGSYSFLGCISRTCRYLVRTFGDMESRATPKHCFTTLTTTVIGMFAWAETDHSAESKMSV